MFKRFDPRGPLCWLLACALILSGVADALSPPVPSLPDPNEQIFTEDILVEDVITEDVLTEELFTEFITEEVYLEELIVACAAERALLFAVSGAIMGSLLGAFATARQVANYRANNGLTWHEMSNMETMQLVPTDIHQAFSHTGSVAEC